MSFAIFFKRMDHAVAFAFFRMCLVSSFLEAFRDRDAYFGDVPLSSRRVPGDGGAYAGLLSQHVFSEGSVVT